MGLQRRRLVDEVEMQTSGRNYGFDVSELSNYE